MANMTFEKSLHQSVWAVYRETAMRSGNTVEAFRRALALVRGARPEMADEAARREVAAMIATEPQDFVSNSAARPG
jgi:hypothetical protein